MNFDPQKLFIGLMDFFSILLPGALLTWLRMGEVGDRLKITRNWPPLQQVTSQVWSESS